MMLKKAENWPRSSLFATGKVSRISFEGLDADQLRERLNVAETLMKKLYNRNKELEEYHTGAM